jgi:hypothetical protein
MKSGAEHTINNMEKNGTINDRDYYGPNESYEVKVRMGDGSYIEFSKVANCWVYR